MAFVFKLECSVYSRNNTVCLDTIMLLRLRNTGREGAICSLYAASCIPDVECSQNGRLLKQDNARACKRATMGLGYIYFNDSDT
jgi:hypothetical protein